MSLVQSCLPPSAGSLESMGMRSLFFEEVVGWSTACGIQEKEFLCLQIFKSKVDVALDNLL